MKYLKKSFDGLQLLLAKGLDKKKKGVCPLQAVRVPTNRLQRSVYFLRVGLLIGQKIIG